MTPKLRTTREERATCLRGLDTNLAWLAADCEALIAENTRLRALLVAEKRARAGELRIGGRAWPERELQLRAEADAIERGEG